jgi:nitric oxide reductase large subunit
MDEPARSFLEFLRSMDLRVFQEREVGLDIYLSGMLAILPVALAIASATVFLLAIFQLIPLRRHSVAALLTAGFLAAAAGLAGAWVNYRGSLRPDAPPPRVISEGRGGNLAKPGQTEALLALPLLLGAGTLLADIGGSLFILAFGATVAKAKGKKASGG